MSKGLFFGILLLTGFHLSAQNTGKKVSTPDPGKKIKIAEAACGQCQFKLPGTGCDLAVRMEGKSWFVEGTDIDSHGDAHAKDGFCNAVRKAEVQGELVLDRFRVIYFKLLAQEKTDGQTKEKN